MDHRNPFSVDGSWALTISRLCTCHLPPKKIPPPNWNRVLGELPPTPQAPFSLCLRPSDGSGKSRCLLHLASAPKRLLFPFSVERGKVTRGAASPAPPGPGPRRGARPFCSVCVHPCVPSGRLRDGGPPVFLPLFLALRRGPAARRPAREGEAKAHEAAPRRPGRNFVCWEAVCKEGSTFPATSDPRRRVYDTRRRGDPFSLPPKACWSWVPLFVSSLSSGLRVMGTFRTTPSSSSSWDRGAACALPPASTLDQREHRHDSRQRFPEP